MDSFHAASCSLYSMRKQSALGEGPVHLLPSFPSSQHLLVPSRHHLECEHRVFAAASDDLQHRIDRVCIVDGQDLVASADLVQHPFCVVELRHEARCYDLLNDQVRPVVRGKGAQSDGSPVRTLTDYLHLFPPSKSGVQHDSGKARALDLINSLVGVLAAVEPAFGLGKPQHPSRGTMQSG
eukprot:CAMPEP_0171070578 /NCGR_PEP_ID=MMETSP0766_2-20121228/9839_1 /TAXON_ID=439317 /ORGANISM="Gambierdiscus australes, Strain CAWD 149" /LENGTH=180 /DNA_ID=CAMNT_0011527075 /DNA_START=105 /DNA_END=644 /DNA_ORIENTATION=-